MTMRSWVEISRAALQHNVRALRGVIGNDRIFCAVVKANAYGHGIAEVAHILQKTFQHSQEYGNVFRGWFGVDSIGEAEALRDIGIRQPIVVLGYVPMADARRVVRTGAHVTVAEMATVRALSRAAGRQSVPVHIKVETGTQRQGIPLRELPAFVRAVERMGGVHIAGIATHLADVEDMGPNGFARLQLDRFHHAVAAVERLVHHPIIRHCAASAAGLVLPDAWFDMVRFGIAMYGFWPSDRIRVATKNSPHFGGLRSKNQILRQRRMRLWRTNSKHFLMPVLAWKTIVGPMHWVPKGVPVGYGCTERVARRTRVAVVPVGYWDGYDRKLSRVAHVLIRGKRCKVIGRVCMNMMMVDVTDAGRVRLEDEVVLIGVQGRAHVTADELAEHIGTINYEVVTRINPLLPRLVV